MVSRPEEGIFEIGTRKETVFKKNVPTSEETREEKEKKRSGSHSIKRTSLEGGEGD